MDTLKKHVVKDFEKLDPIMQKQVKLLNPDGFHNNLITYKDKQGRKVSALPFETNDIYYLLRMTLSEAKTIMIEDDDYDDTGELKEEIKVEYAEKFGEIKYTDNKMGNEVENGDEDIV